MTECESWLEVAQQAGIPCDSPKAAQKRARNDAESWAKRHMHEWPHPDSRIRGPGRPPKDAGAADGASPSRHGDGRAGDYSPGKMGITAPFQRGDVVTLRSGGPAMTVTKVRPSSGAVECMWADEAGAVHIREFEGAGEILRLVGEGEA